MGPRTMIEPIQMPALATQQPLECALTSPDRPRKIVIVLAIVVPGLGICNRNIAYCGSLT
jgi:hypothetical protein